MTTCTSLEAVLMVFNHSTICGSDKNMEQQIIQHSKRVELVLGECVDLTRDAGQKDEIIDTNKPRKIRHHMIQLDHTNEKIYEH